VGGGSREASDRFTLPRDSESNRRDEYESDGMDESGYDKRTADARSDAPVASEIRSQQAHTGHAC